jgi:hypothetical protein
MAKLVTYHQKSNKNDHLKILEILNYTIMRQFTKEQAMKISDSGIWEHMTSKQIVDLQLFQDRLCMPFSVFQKAIIEVLGRSVYTHEFAGHECQQRLIEEYLGNRPAPTFEEIVNMIPELLNK